MVDTINKEELEAAQNESENVISKFSITLRKPIEYNGRTIETLSFDFDKLTGADGLNIEAELQAAGKVVIAPVMSSEYLVRMAAKACNENIGADIFDVMSLKEFNKIRSAARSFLLASE